MAEYIRQDHHLPHGSLEPHITNADRIRSMTDEELAKFIAERNPDLPDVFAEYVLEWLKKEAKDE